MMRPQRRAPGLAARARQRSRAQPPLARAGAWSSPSALPSWCAAARSAGFSGVLRYTPGLSVGFGMREALTGGGGIIAQAEDRALEQRKVARPKSNREQASLLCSLIRQASELPPIPLALAPQQRWALEFEGQTLKTYRRVSDDRWAAAAWPHTLDTLGPPQVVARCEPSWHHPGKVSGAGCILPETFCEGSLQALFK